MRLNAIVAMDDERGIGARNRLLWHISTDLKRFKALTMGHPIIVGRKTFESIGKALPGRTNIVITRRKNFSPEDCVVVLSLDAALAKAAEVDDEEAFIIGGGEIYAQALPKIERLFVTRVAGKHGADTFFPEFENEFREIDREDHAESGHKFSFVTLDRQRPPA